DWPEPHDTGLAGWEPADADLAGWEPADADLAGWEPADADLAAWDLEDAGLAGGDPGDADLAAWDLEDAGLAGGEREDRGPERPGAGGQEVLKAGRWDRARGDGAGFAAGGVIERLPPGPVLAGLAADAWARGLGLLSDDELIGVMRAGRRLASWAAA